MFIRGSHASAKHEWKDSCFVEKYEDLGSHIITILEFAINADIMGIPCDCLALREYIPMDTLFIAFRGKMPVNPEIRYFVREGKVICKHWYWIWNAIQGHNPSIENWKEKLENTEKSISKDEYKLLDRYAVEIGTTLKDSWSIDFCRAKNKQWIFIDCAIASTSWHDENCSFSDMFIKKK